MSGGGRRALREELQATWSVWDASRPIRKEDLAGPQQPVPAQPAAEPSPPPDCGATSTKGPSCP